MTDKYKAAEALNKAGIPADVIDSGVQIKISPEDKDARKKVTDIFEKIGYTSSYGMSLNGVKSDKETKYTAIGVGNNEAADRELEEIETAAPAENFHEASYPSKSYKEAIICG